MRRIVLLGDLANIKHGYAFKGQHFSDTPTNNVLVTPGNFSIGGGFKRDKLKYYDGPVDKDYVLRPNDIIVTMTDLSKEADTLGYSARVPDDSHHIFLHNQRIGLLSTKTKNVELDYLYWVMRSSDYRNWVVSGATGSTVKHTAPSKILSYRFELPNLSDQKKIAAILGALDEKIELNRKMNETLEQMGQALFRHYFITNPDSENWQRSKIGKNCDVLLGGTPSRARKEFWTGGTVGWINSGKVNDFRITEPSELITKEALSKSATKLLPQNTTVLAITGATLGQYSRLEGAFAANQSVIGIVAKLNISNEFVYFWISQSIGKLIGHQTGGAQQHINRDNVVNFEIPIPDNKTLSIFQQQIEPIMGQITNSVFEIQTLATLRDSLLPRLISGKMKV